MEEGEEEKVKDEEEEQQEKNNVCDCLPTRHKLDTRESNNPGRCMLTSVRVYSKSYLP
jgi:hypothetical protein